jgi:Holliday junction resolvase RusA-like endonuclease
MSDDEIVIVVEGIPRPKQSFKFSRTGGYTPARIKAWQNTVMGEAMVVMVGRDPLEGDLHVIIEFSLPDRKRRDIDNLSKAVLDAANKIVWNDDTQITHLELIKMVNKEHPGIKMIVKREE